MLNHLHLLFFWLFKTQTGIVKISGSPPKYFLDGADLPQLIKVTILINYKPTSSRQDLLNNEVVLIREAVVFM